MGKHTHIEDALDDVEWLAQAKDAVVLGTAQVYGDAVVSGAAFVPTTEAFVSTKAHTMAMGLVPPKHKSPLSKLCNLLTGNKSC